MFADPPYNQAISYRDDPSGDWKTPEEYQIWTEVAIHELTQLLAPGATLWWMVPERHADHVGPALTRLCGPRLYRIVFHETFAQYQQDNLTDDYRFIFVHVKQPMARTAEQWGKVLTTFNPNDIREMSVRQEMGDKRADPRGKVPGRVWKDRRLQGTSTSRVLWHPTQLAPELLERVVKGWSGPGDLVVDAFAGSGNMGLACMKHGRRHVGLEQSRYYCLRIKERWGIISPEELKEMEHLKTQEQK